MTKRGYIDQIEPVISDKVIDIIESTYKKLREPKKLRKK
jgi:hypothetical protein